MKKVSVILFAVAMLFSLTQCNNPSPEKACADANMRGKIISVLMNNDAYMSQVMDSMRTKHPDVILSTVFVIAKSDKQMQENMMNKMMDMCDADQSSCKMMSDMMMAHKPMMACMMDKMGEKGMMNMMSEPQKKGKPEDHLKHH